MCRIFRLTFECISDVTDNFLRPLTPKDIALNGLMIGESAPLEIVPIKGKGDGVIAISPISKGSYVTDYKYSALHNTRKEKTVAEHDYELNKEGCYMLEVFHNGKKLYLDATRRFNSYGRYVVIRFSFVSLPQVNILDTLTMAEELLRMSGLILP